MSKRFVKQLGKPIYIEQGITKLKQWALSLLMETRMDVQLKLHEIDKDNKCLLSVGIGDTYHALANQSIWITLNLILSVILDAKKARFVWMGRYSSGLLGFEIDDTMPALPLEALSAGQATLLNIFGTLLRYGDGTTGDSFSAQNIIGICIIDEIDAHIHIDLQHRALPLLIQMFPKVQFIVSSHSPLFVLGMEKSFGTENITIINMPLGQEIQAEAYTEFGQALAVLQGTEAFNQKVSEVIQKQERKTLVFLEGETDPIYLSTAAKLLKIENICEHVKFEWIGAKDSRGQGFHTGKEALNATAKFLKANPRIIKHPIILLYDNDTNKKHEIFENLHVVSIRTNTETKIKVGIENLLPQDAIIESAYSENKKERQDGGTLTIRELDKMRLCKQICEEENLAIFEGFRDVLNMIDSIVKNTYSLNNVDYQA